MTPAQFVEKWTTSECQFDKVVVDEMAADLDALLAAKVEECAKVAEFRTTVLKHLPMHDCKECQLARQIAAAIRALRDARG